MRVLVQLAGTRRNAPEEAQRPGIELPRAAAARDLPFKEAEVIADPATSRTEDIAHDLCRTLERMRLVRRARARALSLPSWDVDAHRIDHARAHVAGVADELAKHHEGRQLVVSIEAGAPAHHVALIEALADRGLAVQVACLSDSGLLEWKASDREPREPHLVSPSSPLYIEHLSNLPDGHSVLLTGPTGSGKSSAALKLHDRWKEKWNRRGKLVHLNCAAIPANLIETELFGHVKGAYTGANIDRGGAFVDAHQGTLFLDEIGELPLPIQAKLLTALDTHAGGRRIRPVGGDDTRETDARLILATNRDLKDAVENGTFRDDLLARISAHVVELPPLAHRRRQILSSYLDELLRLGNDYGNTFFQLELPAWKRIVQLAFDPAHPWRWNFRDVLQSAGRLAFRAWGEQGYATEGRSRTMIRTEHVTLEEEELLERWRVEDSKEEPELIDLAELEAHLAEGAWDRLSQLERWEAWYLLQAKRATDSNAAAWRWLCARKLLPINNEVTNPSNAFGQRWRRFPWASPR